MRRPEPDDIRVRLSAPATRIAIGPLVVDPLAEFLGVSLREVLDSLLEAEPYPRTSSTGAAVEIFPLALPAGEGAVIPLGPLGEVALENDAGLLALTVPAAMAGWVSAQAAAMVVRGPERHRSTAGPAMLAQLWIRLRPSARAALPLGLLGEMAIEAA